MKMIKGMKWLSRSALLGIASLSLAGCVVEPYPGPPAGPPVAVAQPCCYAYPQYPATYYAPAYYGPTVGVGIYGGGWGGGGRRWR